MVNKNYGTFFSNVDPNTIYSLLVYGPSMICANSVTPAEAIFNLGWDEDDIINAIEYWENNDLSNVYKYNDDEEFCVLKTLKQNYIKYLNDATIMGIIK